MSPVGVFFPPLSLLWSSINFFRRLAYARGLLPQTKLDAGLVVSVGNVEAGGTGKTPVTAFLAREAVTRGLTVAVLTRGYRSASERQAGGAVLRPGDHADPSVVGDEPALIHLLVPEAWIGIGANRIESYTRLLRAHGKPFDLVLLDDGFQHLKIARDVDLVLKTSRGYFDVLKREFEASLPSSAVVIQTKGLVETRTSEPGQIVFDLEFSAKLNPKEPLWVVAGVADPKSVAYSLQASGYRVSKLIAGRDHAHYSQAEVATWLAQASSEAARLVLTGKDYVKWLALDPSLAQNPKVIWIEPRARVVAGQDTWFAKLWRKSP